VHGEVCEAAALREDVQGPVALPRIMIRAEVQLPRPFPKGYGELMLGGTDVFSPPPPPACWPCCSLRTPSPSPLQVNSSLHNFPAETAIFHVNSLCPSVFISIAAPSREPTVKSVPSQRRPERRGNDIGSRCPSSRAQAHGRIDMQMRNRRGTDG